MSCSEAAAKKIPEQAQASDETAETFPRNELSALVNHAEQEVREMNIQPTNHARKLRYSGSDKRCVQK
jgi:hypothetical protein